MLTSDRLTHLKIIMTAALAVAAVMVIGIYAKPAGTANGHSIRAGTSYAIIASFDQLPTASH